MPIQYTVKLSVIGLYVEVLAYTVVYGGHVYRMEDGWMPKDIIYGELVSWRFSFSTSRPSQLEIQRYL